MTFSGHTTSAEASVKYIVFIVRIYFLYLPLLLDCSFTPIDSSFDSHSYLHRRSGAFCFITALLISFSSIVLEMYLLFYTLVNLPSTGGDV